MTELSAGADRLEAGLKKLQSQVPALAEGIIDGISATKAREARLVVPSTRGKPIRSLEVGLSTPL